MASDWPGGLNDEDATQRLQGILIQACEGARDLSIDREYKAFRAVLIRRADLSDVVPKFVRSSRDLLSFWAYIRKVSDQWQPRREHVWEAFRPIFDRLEGRSVATSAAKWTGRRTAAQQAKIVLAVAPTALAAVNQLIDEQQARKHNQGPSDADVDDAIEKLRALRDAISELINLAENGRPLATSLRGVKALRNSILKWSAQSYELLLANSPLYASSAVAGSALWFATYLLTKDMGASATFTSAITGATALNSRRNVEREA